MAYASDILSARGGLRDRVIAIRKAIAESRAQRKVYQTTLTELRSLNNRELADLGISASEIPFIAREAAYGSK